MLVFTLSPPMKIFSFGYKYGIPDFTPKKPLIIDVRDILTKNPYHNPALRHLRGDHSKVIAEIESSHPHLEKDYKKLLEKVSNHNGHVCVGCTGGHHRSVYIAHRLGKDLNRTVVHLNYNSGLKNHA